MKSATLLKVLLCLAAVLVPLSGFLDTEEGIKGDRFSGDVRCIMDFGDYRTEGLLPGMHYELIKLFADKADFNAIVEDNPAKANYLDSLREGKVGMVAVRMSDSLDTSGLLVSIPIARDYRWLVRDSCHTRMKEINAWYAHFSCTKDSEDLIKRFSISYNPYTRYSTGKTYTTLSPYDGFIRKYASVIGWDWRKFAALIWSESKFSIAARSHMGARGIMQLRPATAENFGVKDPLDPEENIAAGAELIKTLQENLSTYALDEDELEKYTLAAYNAGLGSVRKRIAEADSLGIRAQLSDDTAGYVASVRELYGILCSLTTEP